MKIFTVEEIKKILTDPETWMKLGGHVVKIIFILLLAAVVINIGKAFIRRLFKIKIKRRHSARREQTLLKLLENTLSYVVYFSAILAILSEFMNVSGILASAGVLGLAVGFGAQSLVKDIISGFFIIFEDQFSVGDYIQVDDSLGTVLEIGLRTTKIQAHGGEVYIIPNGNISEVTNFSLYNGMAVLEVSVDYEMDVEEAENLMVEFIENLSFDQYEELVDTPKLVGVQDLTATEIVFRITAETKPVMQWAFARKFRKDLKIFLDEHGIVLPYQKIAYKKIEERVEDES